MEQPSGFWVNTGKFKGRQHLISHVDMILGTGVAEEPNPGLRQVAVSWEGDRGGWVVAHALIGDMEPDWAQRARDWALRNAAYASEWQQLTPYREVDGQEAEYAPEDVADERDSRSLLYTCIDSWIAEDHGGDSDDFWSVTPIVVLLADWGQVTCDRIVVRRRPEEGEEQPVAAINGRVAMRRKYGDSEAWHTFAEAICHSEHVKAELVGRQDGRCAICGKELTERVVVHHLDYDHECGMVTTGADGSATRDVPNCKLCHEVHPKLFEGCVRLLRAVHSDCNYLIEATL